MKKMLVTGASGFLGRRIVDFYTGTYEVFAPTHGEMDITEADGTVAFFRKYQPDFAVHCAAMSDVGMCEKEPEQSYPIDRILYAHLFFWIYHFSHIKLQAAE